MEKTIRFRTVAILSFAAVYLFFIDYLPPLRRFYIPYDLEGYHHPLADYAFQSLRQGRFPLWDPSIYCGLSFVSNVQAALFYPPTWLMFAANAGRRELSYQSLEDLVLAHVWVAFLLCYVWLRRKPLAPMAAALGAAVFAFSGYMLLQLQHFGLVAGYTWFPLGLWGIDEAVSRRHWRPLWKVAAASALCFLAGYPPTWFVFAVTMVAYAGWRWKTALQVIAALAASFLPAMVQLLPALYATGMKDPEVRYGAGIRRPEFYLSYLLPNYFDFGLHADPSKYPGGEYLYLGAPALFGLALLARRKKAREWLPLALVAAVTLVFVTNAFGLVWGVIRHSGLLVQICRDWYFLAGLTLAAAGLAAYGLDECLREPRRPAPSWMAWAVVLLLAAWSVRQLIAWLPAGSTFPAGWGSAAAPAVTLVLFSAGMLLLPRQKGRARAALAAAILFAVGADYKVFGTGKRTNSAELKYLRPFTPRSLFAMDQADFDVLRASAPYRIVEDLTGPFPIMLRHAGMTTPQGFDPFLTRRYRKLMTRIAHFRTDRDIDIDPANGAALRLLGVRYIITAEPGPMFRYVSTSPDFREVPPSKAFYRVYEYVHARPPYGWAEENSGATVERIAWAPEKRGFEVDSAAGGLFTLSEQLLPGWSATVDGRAVPIEIWNDAFQAVRVPAGRHRVEFVYRAPGLAAGAAVSLAGLAGLLFVARNRRASGAARR